MEKQLIEQLLNGERSAVAKAISYIENEQADARTLVKKIFKKTGNAHTFGITGSGGSGKSTLIDKLIPEYRSLGYKVAVLAVDPTSSISGGAILGDRVRMQKHALDDGTFIRSMGSRGAIGGLSRAVRNTIRVLDAAGFDIIIIESVGAGQLDIEISKIVDITVVVFNPQTGDSIQAIKAGLTEVGDLYVINKGDLIGANKLFNEISDLIGNTSRNPMVFKVVARTGKGVNKLVKAMKELTKVSSYKELKRKRVEAELMDMVLNMVGQKVYENLDKNDRYQECVDQLLKKKMNPYEAAEELIKNILK
ncbi:MAG: methylmalonyl Co-A mutase-associated GTPase MeaB [Thaumarchaeota archaeon]|nr:methylmalonyl Co-A mutase-associated GTPase MeaB [Nitrososphaerota archaeon]